MAIKVVEVNVGEKIPYEIKKNTRITFDDELMVNLEKMERDYDVNIDICYDKWDMLTTGLGERYVAQILIPARQYKETEVDNPDYDSKDKTSQKTIVQQEAVPFSIDNCTLSLYSIE